jgi:hypothetical protein
MGNGKSASAVKKRCRSQRFQAVEVETGGGMPSDSDDDVDRDGESHPTKSQRTHSPDGITSKEDSDPISLPPSPLLKKTTVGKGTAQKAAPVPKKAPSKNKAADAVPAEKERHQFHPLFSLSL